MMPNGQEKEFACRRHAGWRRHFHGRRERRLSSHLVDVDIRHVVLNASDHLLVGHGIGGRRRVHRALVREAEDGSSSPS